MRASIDTNVIIHLYKAGLQDVLFSFFDEGVCIYEQIRNVELNNHGKDVLDNAIYLCRCINIKIFGGNG